MDLRVANLRRFLYSHYFFGGARQGIGMLLPVLILGGVLDQYAAGLVATFGALCVAIIDQPGPHWHRTNEMLGGSLLGTLAVTVTGLASSHPAAIWLAVIAQCFAFGMFTVFGKKGGQIGFACLLLMTLTMHAPLTPDDVLMHAAATLGGGLFYIGFSLAVSRLTGLREEQQALSVALYATAEYMAARSSFYDAETDLDETYRKLIVSQSAMTEKHQAARDMVLRALPRQADRPEPRRVMLWNLFVDMIALLDTLVATHTDYALLRRTLQGSDLLPFCRDALLKMSIDLDRLALAVSRNRPARYRASVKAELRAIEYEIEQLRQDGLNTRDPEVYALLIQIQRRLRNAARVVERLYQHTEARPDAKPEGELRLDKSLTQFLSRQQFRVGMLTSNLRLNSPHCRYALRLTLAVAIAMTLSSSWLFPSLAPHGYWIVLTILVIMKPGFALTRQRNGLRLVGTLLGCLLALGLFHATDRPGVLFAAMLAACIMGNSLVQLNYMASAVFNTVFVLLSFHFISPGPLEVIGERALDTVIGCALALVCSYVLPWWEYRYMGPRARAAIAANRAYLQAGLDYVRAVQARTADTQARVSAAQTAEAAPPAAAGDKPAPSIAEADFAWRLARKNVHIAFSNFAEAFYRMMREPQSRQRNVPELNNLLIQNHILASQIAASVSLLVDLPRTPQSIQQALDYIGAALQRSEQPLPEPPAQVPTDGDLAGLAYPIKQMIKATQMIRHEMGAIAERPAAVGPTLEQALKRP